MMSKKSVVIATLGFLIVGLIAWMHGLPLAGWIDAPTSGARMGLVPLSMILVVIGILAFLHEETSDSIVFFGYAALTWSHQPAQAVTAPPAAGAAGWNLIIWAVFFSCVWWGSRRAGGTRALFLLGLWLSMLAGAVKFWSGLHVFSVIEGYLELAAGLLALFTSAKAMASSGGSGTNGSTV